MGRQDDIDRFYRALEMLRRKLGGERYLRSCDGKMNWPEKGIYFFFEHNEVRDRSDMLRVVRVGTHAVSRGSKTKLWDRLRQHRGTLTSRFSGGGNHRGSIFRLNVGAALLNVASYPPEVQESWGKGSSASSEVRISEHPLECEVSIVIRKMPFLWLKVEEEPGPDSKRKFLERNTIALLSNANKSSIDQPSPEWLGQYCPNNKIRQAGLWNADHVFEKYEPSFLKTLEDYVNKI